MNHPEIGRIETMIDEIVIYHHTEIAIGIDSTVDPDPDHRLDLNDVKITSDAIVHRTVIRTETKIDDQEVVRPENNLDNRHLRIDIKVIGVMIQIKIIQITGIAANRDQCHQDESRAIDVHAPKVDHPQDEQMIPN